MVETCHSDLLYLGQIDHYKRMIIITVFFLVFFISYADYYLIDISICIIWI